jgi:hypothetical protein
MRTDASDSVNMIILNRKAFVVMSFPWKPNAKHCNKINFKSQRDVYFMPFDIYIYIYENDNVGFQFHVPQRLYGILEIY